MVDSPRSLPSGGTDPPAERPTPLWPSSVLPGQPDPPPPRIKPPGYMAPSEAYDFISSLPYLVVAQIAEGIQPDHVAWGERVLTAQHVRAARELLSTKGNPVEINARQEGPIKQLVQKTGEDVETKAILALLASLPPPAAARREPESKE